MRFSRYIVPTLKEDPADAVVKSHRLMLRAGLVRKESAGMYVYLPLGWRVLRKIISIIREEMDASGALEFLMPELTNSELWKQSGRWQLMGKEMIRIKDRNGIEYALAPTHEEAFTSVINSLISSYRDLPVNAYQINTKFRDEIRPRFGVIRSKEFIMKDAYSFDIDENGLEESYQIMRKTYRRIFERCGLETIPVQADSGNMGGSASEEFMVASEIGEETLLICPSCGYMANQEKALYKRPAAHEGQQRQIEELREVSTPDVKTINELALFFKCGAEKFLKSIVYLADGKPLMTVVLGDREVNEQKLKNFLGASELELASDDIIVKVTGAPVGFAGPVGSPGIRTVFDVSVRDTFNAVTGANKKDVHYSGVNPGRDFEIQEEADITSAMAGDACPLCANAMNEKKGIEVGHIFKLGYMYTKAMNVSVLDETGKSITPIMGCYGIGVNRTLASVIEQHNDEHGIIWPAAISPFDIHLVGLGKTTEEASLVDEIYNFLNEKGYETLYDDRKTSPGIKFADADLLGMPVRITAGKTFFKDGEIELKSRSTGENIKVKLAELPPAIDRMLGR
ncbi:MAG: proline--tRNA ligase [Leptospirales bacterium]|nr:proline--tRNA ligase [Leptospirales bacterium]